MEAMKKQFIEKLQEMNNLMNGYLGQIAMRSAIREFFWENKFFMGQFMMAIDEMVDEEGEAYAKGEVDMLPEMQNFKQWGEHLVKHVNEEAVSAREDRWFKKWADDFIPRAEKVMNELNFSKEKRIVANDWVLHASTQGAIYANSGELPWDEEGFFEFCKAVEIEPSDELKALWMAD